MWWKKLSNAGKFWVIIGIIFFIFLNIHCIPWFIKTDNREIYHHIFMLYGSVFSFLVDLIILIFLMSKGILKFNKFLNNLKFEKKPKPVKIEFKDINEFNK